MPARWLWVSATSRGDRLAAAHPSVLTLRGEDWRLLQTCTLLRAHKPLMRSSVSQTQAARSYYPQNLARLAMARHHQGSLTMVVVNQVDRARAVYRQLLKMGRQPQNTALLHSDLHGDDLALQESILHQPGDRIVVATPSIEAGADVSACALLTELAPWPALVQRAGRCNRYGEQRHAQILWVDMDEETLAQQPYPAHELRQTRDILRGLVDMNMTTVRSVCWSPQQT
jgi:CRISPR-associated endonuclease/helicase Cas3